MNTFFRRLLGIGLCAVAASTASAQHERLIVARVTAPLPFDPLTERYQAGSWGAVASFARQWREELGAGNVYLFDAGDPPAEGYRLYAALGDSTLARRAARAAGCSDDRSLLAGFGFTPRTLDSLGVQPGEGTVADRYTVQGRQTIRLRRVSFSDERPDKAFTEAFADEEQRIRRFFATPVAQLATTITTRDSYFGPSAFNALFHRFQRSVAPAADVSLFAPPRFDATLAAGPLYLKTIATLFSYDNRLVTVRVTGQQIDEFLEQVYGMGYFTLKGPESDLIRTRIPHYLYDDASGIRYRVDLTQRSGRRVAIYQLEDGRPFRPGDQYTVVLNSFRARYFTERGIPVHPVAADYRLALLQWLSAQPEPIAAQAPDNWSLAPERWVEAIARRERPQLFP